MQVDQSIGSSRTSSQSVNNSLNYMQLAAQAQALGLSLIPTNVTPQAFFGNRQSSSSGYRSGNRGGRGRNNNRNTHGGRSRGPDFS